MRSVPSVGHAKGVFYLIVGEDLACFREKYSAEEVESLTADVAAVIVLSRQNARSAEEISRMVGGAPGRRERSESLTTQAILSIPPFKQIVIAQDRSLRPILCDTPRFFEERWIAPRVFNVRNREGPPPAPPMPLNMIDEAARRNRER